MIIFHLRQSLEGWEGFVRGEGAAGLCANPDVFVCFRILRIELDGSVAILILLQIVSGFSAGNASAV
jgi:hypothetical protein